MTTMQVERKDHTENDIVNLLWFKYYPYWPLFVVLIFLCLGGAWLYLRQAPSLYEAKATILIKDENKGLYDSKMMESLNQLSTSKIIENETEVIRSKTLMYEVVKNLHLYAPVFEEGKIRAVSAYSTSPIKVIAKNPDSLQGSDKIYFRFDSTSSQVIIDSNHYPLNVFTTTDYGVLKFAPNRLAIKTPKQSLFFFLVSPKMVVNDLVNRLEVSAASKLASVLNLKIKDEEPKRSEDILNELLRAYSQAALREKNSLAANTLSFVEERLSYVSQDLDSIQRKLEKYKARHNAVDIGQQGKLFLDNVSANDQKLSDINMRLAVLDQVENYVLSKENAGGIVPSTLGIEDPLLSDLLNKLYESELEYQKLSNTTAENNPLLVSITEQKNKIKPSILENINSHRKSLEASKKNLSTTNDYYASMLQSIPQKERDLVEISRAQTIKNSIYNFLLQKREEAALSHSSTVADSRIIDKADSTLEPVSPNKKLIYLISVFLALILGVALVSGKELSSRTILYRREIEAITTIPIIGEIAQESSRNPLVIGNGKRTFVAEQFRKLRVSLDYLGIGPKRKKVLITSPLSGEGKSFVAANLALSLALAGKKVVLVELDLSNPSMGEKLNMEAEKGVTNFLTEDCEPFDIIKQTEAHENLFFIPCGPLPNNPTELLLSDQVKNLLSYLDKIFDYIIVDTAPVGPTSDAYILSPLCDATLYIIRHRHTPKLLIQRLDEDNKINKLKNLAIIFNGVKQRGFSKNGYGYGYSYSYGYVFKEQERRIKA
jgi:tyrosine-protein kinase Etk/Wzc